MKWTTFFLGLAALLLAGGAAGPKDHTGEVREYLQQNLPESYTASSLFALEVREEDGVCSARITLDMAADGSDYTSFGEDDFMMLAELEAGYLLENALTEPPVPTDFLLEMRVGEEPILVERRWEASWGTLTYGDARMDISFEDPN